MTARLPFKIYFWHNFDQTRWSRLFVKNHNLIFLPKYELIFDIFKNNFSRQYVDPKYKFGVITFKIDSVD